MDNPYPICENCIYVDEPLDKDPCQECNRAFLAQRIKPNFVSKRKPNTNADRIRSMTDEELARMLASNADCNECRIYAYKDACMENYDTCVCQWLGWLRHEIEEGE